MTTDLIKIVYFSDAFQSDIDEMMTYIENEFIEPISNSNTKQKKISELALLSTEKYWVALSNGKAIGTIGLSMLSDEKIVMKRMFVSHLFRGKGVAKLLLDALHTWAEEKKIKGIYLGTMDQFKAAQRFYEKNGFTRIKSSLLPDDFPINPVDNLFYSNRK